MSGDTDSYRTLGLIPRDKLALDETVRTEVVTGFFARGRPPSLLQRLATADEVANLITYLVSPRSAATNVVAVRVEGGSIPATL